MDNDGDLDISLVNMDNSCVYVFYNNGNGNFDYNVKYLTQWVSFPRELHMNDFNNDGYIDAAVNSFTNGGIVLFNDNNGGFVTVDIDTGRFAHPEEANYFTYGDMNGDNKLDIIVTNVFFPGWPDTLNNYAEIGLNSGGTYCNFATKDSIILGKVRDTNLYDVLVADLDGDGDLDIVHVGHPTLISYNQAIISDIEKPVLPVNYTLEQNFPNPFNPSTQINYSIKQEGFVTIKVYDIIGNEIATLLNELKAQGNYTVNFNGANLSSGVYIYTIKATNFLASKKMLIIK